MAILGSIIDGRYQVVEELARGGMGVVYRVVHRFSGRDEALKLIHAEIAADEEYRTRFLVEAQAVAKLTNLHTVTLYDCGITEEGQLYIAMELLNGSSLDVLLRSEGPLPYPRAVALVVQACRSLEEAHSKGIIHRDIKPGNLILTKTEEGGDHVKVLDFGIARLEGEGRYQGLTATGTVLGTPLYMSPEQHLGRRVGPTTDVYALGLVLYELICGQSPFKADSIREIRRRHLEDPPPPVNVTAPGTVVPAALEQALLDALQKSPGQRIPSILDLRRRLEQFLESETSGETRPRGEQVGDGAPRQPVSQPTVSQVDPLGATHGPSVDVPEHPNLQGLSEVLPAVDIKPPRVTLIERLGGERWGRFLGTGLLLVCALAVGAVLPLLAPSRWLDGRIDTLRQTVNLSSSPGRAVVVKVDIDRDKAALRAAGHPIPGVEGHRTWRAVDALLLARLTEAEAEVVVFDKFFGRDFPDETRVLAASVRSAVASGTHVIVGALDRPPPPALVDAGAFVGSLRAEQRGDTGTVHRLLTRFPLLDGTEVPSLFVRAYCLSRVAPRGGRPEEDALCECEDDVIAGQDRWHLRYGRSGIETLRLSDALGWSLEDLATVVRGQVVFVGHFEEAVDEVPVPAVLSLEPTARGTAHGVMLLASAFNQVDTNADWFNLGRWISFFLFVLFAAVPYLYTRRLRWPFPWLVSLAFVGGASILGLVLPVTYPWGGAFLAGLAVSSILMLPSWRCHRRGKALADTLERCLKRFAAGGDDSPFRVRFDPAALRRLWTPVRDELGGMALIKHLHLILNGRDAGGELYRTVPAAFFHENGWLRDESILQEQPPGVLSALNNRFVGTLAQRLHRRFVGEGELLDKDLAIVSTILKTYAGVETKLSVGNWMTLQRRLTEQALEYCRRLLMWSESPGHPRVRSRGGER